mmetsp:Transcript_9753/g.59237  ORF Transcript_9753/g.59237 Transcript_9753/m.59237 type:complete len:191 (-) Transcript_9753:4003-4575(-)
MKGCALFSTEETGASSVRRKFRVFNEWITPRSEVADHQEHSYLKVFDTLREDMEEHGFKIYGISAEYPDMTARTRKAWGLSFELHGNPSNTLVKRLKEDNIIDLTITPRKGFENGFIQPGLLFIQNIDGKPKVILAWASELDKGKGAWGRPQPADSWDAVKKTLRSQSKPELQEIPRTTFGSLCNVCALQ